MKPRVGDESPPREFWISNSYDLNYRGIFNGPQPDLSNVAHVREVIESPTDEQIRNRAKEDYSIRSDALQAFEAGARWAIAKLTGGSK